jgi:hypothetical protein
VATAWTLAFEDLQQATPGAAGLLRLLAFCAPEAVPCGCYCGPAKVPPNPPGWRTTAPTTRTDHRS